MKTNDESNDSIEQRCRKKFTISDLKKYKGFENFTDEQAEEYIETMYRFCILAYRIYGKDKIEQQNKLKHNEEP